MYACLFKKITFMCRNYWWHFKNECFLVRLKFESKYLCFQYCNSKISLFLKLTPISSVLIPISDFCLSVCSDVTYMFSHHNTAYTNKQTRTKDVRFIFLNKVNSVIPHGFRSPPPPPFVYLSVVTLNCMRYKSPPPPNML